MIGYLVPVSCPRCAAQLEHTAGSTAAGTEATAVARCAGCGREWQVIVHLRPAPTPEADRRRQLRTTAA